MKPGETRRSEGQGAPVSRARGKTAPCLASVEGQDSHGSRPDLLGAGDQEPHPKVNKKRTVPVEESVQLASSATGGSEKETKKQEKSRIK